MAKGPTAPGAKNEHLIAESASNHEYAIDAAPQQITSLGFA